MPDPSRTSAVQEPLPHIAALDGVRGLAILLVVLYHVLWANRVSHLPILTFILQARDAG